MEAKQSSCVAVRGTYEAGGLRVCPHARQPDREKGCLLAAKQPDCGAGEPTNCVKCLIVRGKWPYCSAAQSERGGAAMLSDWDNANGIRVLPRCCIYAESQCIIFIFKKDNIYIGLR
jgi:hypothetical protein